jgi:hypothetical protein
MVRRRAIVAFNVCWLQNDQHLAPRRPSDTSGDTFHANALCWRGRVATGSAAL